MTAASSHPYRHRRAGLATQHDKLPLVGPALHRATGLEVVQVDVDTDVLGTFTGEVPRTGSPWDTAVAKARLGMRASGLSIGVASEGTFGPLDGAPFIRADRELVVLVDDELGIEIGEGDLGLGLPMISVDVDAEALDMSVLESAGFPEHGVIVRTVDAVHPVVKGIHDVESLWRAIELCAAASRSSMVRIESDLRAHHHPSRREVIARAAERLAVRLATLCPECRTPGWGIGRRVPGAPCALCRTPTHLPRHDLWVCASCEHEESVPTPEAAGVDPECCPRCNP